MKRSKDFDVRAALVRRLLAEGVERRSIRHELTLDTSSSGGRVDLALLRESGLIAIEIKSGSDKLDRLKQQYRAMQRAFDFTFNVIDTALKEKVEGSFWAAWPIWYSHAQGCFVDWAHVNGGGWVPHHEGRPVTKLRYHRKSLTTNTADMARLLWKDEACAISASMGGATKTREAAIDWLRENARLRDVRPLVIKYLRERVPNRWEEAFWARFDDEAEAA